MLRIGYVRLRDMTAHEDSALLKAAGCQVVRAEEPHAGGHTLSSILDFIGVGDQLVVTRLDRLALTGRGLLDATISPDGRQMAVTRIGASGRSELFVTKPGDFDLVDARRMGVIACKVIWRPDGRELLVVQADDCLGSATGELVLVPIDAPRQQRSLRLTGDNPSFQPLTAG